MEVTQSTENIFLLCAKDVLAHYPLSPPTRNEANGGQIRLEPPVKYHLAETSSKKPTPTNTHTKFHTDSRTFVNFFFHIFSKCFIKQIK